MGSLFQTNGSSVMQNVTQNSTLNSSVEVDVAGGSSSSSRGLSPMAFVIISVQLLFCVLSVVSNALVIVVRSKVVAIRQAISPLLVNLSIIDMMTGLSLFYQISFFFARELSTTKFTCMLRFQSIIFFTIVSLFTLLAVAIERYLHVFHAVKHQRYIQKSKLGYTVALVSVYTLSMLYFLYPFFGLNNWDGRTRCVFPLIMQGSQMLILCTTVWLVALVCTVVYALVLRAVYKQKSKIAPRTQVESISSESSGNASTYATYSGPHMKTLRVVIAVTIATTICWLPYSVIEFLHFLTPWSPMKTKVGDLLVFLGVANSFMNPIIYVMSRTDFRAGLMQLCCRRVSLI